jgi:hypothetical protein
MPGTTSSRSSTDLIDLFDHVPAKLGQLFEQIAIVAKTYPQTLGHGENELTMRDVLADLFANVAGQFEDDW